MTFRNRLAVLPLLFLLAGCMLESEYSLGDSHNAPMDQRLLGKWADADSKKAARGTLSFYRFNENEYYIESIDHETGKADRFRGYLAPIDNVPILNVQEITDRQSTRDFLFVKVSLPADNVLKLYIVEDSLLAGKSISSRSELISYIRTNNNNPRLFDNAIMLRRKVE